jgi:hypothetical protein
VGLVSLSRPQRNYFELGVLLALGLINGLIYVFLIPPWQHYDEPNQFEYSWLVANLPRWPERRDFDLQMRREVAASMIEHDFYKELDYRPNLLFQDGPVSIGINQLGDRPFYYWYTALPLRILKHADITAQLYATRLASMLLFLMILIFARGVMQELFPNPASPFRWLVPVSMAMLPGFVDLMTANNNDVGATWAFSGFLWGSLRLLNRGLKPFEIIWTLSFALLCYFTKSTVYLAVPLFGAVLLFTVFRRKSPMAVWGMLGLVGVVALIAGFTWGNAYLWTPTTDLLNATRVASPNAPAGSYQLVLTASPSIRNPRLNQIVPTNTVAELGGKSVTFGGWVWSSDSTRARISIRTTGNVIARHEFQPQSEPVFFAAHAIIPVATERMWVEIGATSQNADEQTEVYFDGIMLVDGIYPVGIEPQLDDTHARSGSWDRNSFSNLIRNASGEIGWFEIRPWVYQKLNEIPINFAILVSSLVDLPGAGWYYKSSFRTLFETFWGRFGWGHVPLLFQDLYKLLFWICLLGVTGNLIFVWKRKRMIQPGVAFLLAAAFMTIWTQTTLRGIGTLFGHVFFPSARYAFPAIIPTMTLLVTGWVEINHGASKLVKIPPYVGLILYFLFLLGLNGLSILSIVQYYYR